MGGCGDCPSGRVRRAKIGPAIFRVRPRCHLPFVNSALPIQKIARKKGRDIKGVGPMINQMMEHRQGTRSWVLSPSCLIDRLLDQIEKLSAFVLPAKAGSASYMDAEIEARVEHLGV
jgi:hypothetical protein